MKKTTKNFISVAVVLILILSILFGSFLLYVTHKAEKVSPFVDIKVTIIGAENAEKFTTQPFIDEGGVGVAVPLCLTGSDYKVSLDYGSNKLSLTFDNKSETQSLSVEKDKGYAIALCNKAGKEKDASVITFYEATLASVFINTASGTMESVNVSEEHSVKEEGTIKVVNSNGETEYDGGLEWIKGRGNYTWELPKRPYNIKLEKKAEILGLNKAKKFCLLANYADESNLRNALAFDMAKALDIRFAVNYSFANLYLNGEYNGLYIITDKVDIGGSNVDIADLEKETEDLNTNLNDLEISSFGEIGANGSYSGIPNANNPQDITGGYLFETSCVEEGKYQKSTCGFVSNNGQAMVFKSPERITQEQAQYISEYYQELEDALLSRDGVNEKTGKHYSEYIDVKSFAKWYLIEEFSCDIDAGIYSNFFYKDSSLTDGKIYAGPIWDFDSAFHSEHNTCYYYSSGCEFIKQFTPQRDGGELIKALSGNELFLEEVKTVFEKELAPFIDKSGDYFKNTKALINNDAQLNERKWNADKENTSYAESADELERFVKSRNEFLKGFWLNGEEYITVKYGTKASYAHYSMIKPGEAFYVPLKESDDYVYEWYYSGTNDAFVDGTVLTEDTELEIRQKDKV